MTFTFDLWPWPSNWGEIFVQCTEMPSFIVVRLVVRKLSCGKQTKTLTNTLTNKQTPLKTSTSLRYNTPVGNNWLLLHYCFARVQRVAAWFVQSCWFATHTHAAWVSQQHDYELQVNMIEVTKQWLFELWQSSNVAVISCYQLLFLFYSIDYTIYGVMQHGSINLVVNWVKFWAVCWGHSWGEKKLTAQLSCVCAPCTGVLRCWKTKLSSTTCLIAAHIYWDSKIGSTKNNFQFWHRNRHRDRRGERARGNIR